MRTPASLILIAGLLATAGAGLGVSHQQSAAGTDPRAVLDRYCVGCHNARSNTPAANPLKLDSVDFVTPEKDALTFERVIKKLSVGAMPPQGVPHPEPAALNAFANYLTVSLDKAAAAQNDPGRYVGHRLNRLEYQNAIRDLVGVDFDAASLLPSDGGDFGFDNIAAALRTSPLLLERYVTAAQRISTLAIGDPKQAPGTVEYSMPREFSQNTHIEGLPLGTRGGTLVRHVFPADAEYKLAARLFRGVEEGYVGVEGNDTPHTFVITIDGDEVFTTTIGGPKDHEEQGKSLTETQPLGVDGGNRAATGQDETQGFGETCHGARGAHYHARAVSRHQSSLRSREARLFNLSSSMQRPEPAAIGARAEPLPLVAAGKHGSDGRDERRNVGADGAHQLRWNRLVASADEHDGVEWQRA